MCLSEAVVPSGIKVWSVPVIVSTQHSEELRLSGMVDAVNKSDSGSNLIRERNVIVEMS
jgi:hypothetical protein